MLMEKDRKFKGDEYYGWRAINGTVNAYLDICKRAVMNDSVFETFKSDWAYNLILEHLSADEGRHHIDSIAVNNPDLLKEARVYIKANDSVGAPRVSSYEEYGIGEASPSTLRYIKVLSDLMMLYGDLSGMNIVEIGSGYGGLALVISKKFKFSKYYNVDLLEPARLAEKYCKFHDIDNFLSITPDELYKLKGADTIDLVISNYAFSECNEETQDVYIEKILSKAERGYLIHNSSEARRQRTKSIIENYDNFQVFGRDFSKKQHPIFTWGR